jgi:1-phosphofructokinase
MATAIDVTEISVLAPSPLFTVTIEREPSGSDAVYFHAGGQGFWVSRMIRNLGAIPILCGPFGGETGTILKTLIESEAIRTVPVAVAAWNGGYVQDRRTGERQTLANMPHPHLNRHEIDDVFDTALAQGFRTGTLVLTGTARGYMFPPEFYRNLAKDLGDNGVTVIADLSGPNLRALAGGIDFLKVSHLELIENGYCADDSKDAIFGALAELRATGARNIIISCAEAPALSLVDGQAFEVVPPKFQPLDFRGAGDSMTAALAYARAMKLDTDHSLRLAAAAGALNVTRHGLGTGQLSDIQEIATHVQVRKL